MIALAVSEEDPLLLVARSFAALASGGRGFAVPAEDLEGQWGPRDEPRPEALAQLEALRPRLEELAALASSWEHATVTNHGVCRVSPGSKRGGRERATEVRRGGSVDSIGARTRGSSLQPRPTAPRYTAIVIEVADAASVCLAVLPLE